MSSDRSQSRGGDSYLSNSSSQRGYGGIRLPPMRLEGQSIAQRGRSFPRPAIPPRSMHQIQLELEYEAEESDNDSDRPTLPGWPGALERHQSNDVDSVGEHTKRQIHALCIFDEISISPHEQPHSYLIDALASRAPLRRRWGRWRWREQPVYSQVHVAEAVLVYECGSEKTHTQRCNRCRAGQGISPHCVVVPEEVTEGRTLGPCSNCIYDGIASTCDVSRRGSPPRHDVPGSNEPLGNPDNVVDHMAVLEMIASLKRPVGARRDQSLPARAQRIEAAALHIARAAREWGERMSAQQR